MDHLDVALHDRPMSGSSGQSIPLSEELSNESPGTFCNTLVR
jgi:hypothetical protein